MGETKLTFKRYEKKYLLSPERYAALRQQLDEHIVPDVYFKSTVCSIYYDSDDYQLIRHSIEGPVYKEKLRVRSYNVPGPDDTVFVELKKKYKGIVYKRRVTMSAARAADWFFRRGVQQVVITMGGMGAYVSDGTRSELTPAFRVDAIDTTGAGDAYNGGFVTALSRGMDLFDAARYGNCTGALSVTRPGTAPAMPRRDEIDALYQRTYGG